MSIQVSVNAIIVTYIFIYINRVQISLHISVNYDKMRT